MVAKRMAKRVVRHIKEPAKAGEWIPEARFPLPKYIIGVTARKIVDLAPQKIGDTGK